MICSFDLDNKELDEHDPFGEYLAQVAWAIRCTYHNTLKATPGQLVYGRGMILDIPYTANWSKINSRKQELIDKSKERENNKRFNYNYAVGDKVLINYDEICQKLTHHRCSYHTSIYKWYSENSTWLFTRKNKYTMVNTLR
jgi:hypothetical protein